MNKKKILIFLSLFNVIAFAKDTNTLSFVDYLTCAEDISVVSLAKRQEMSPPPIEEPPTPINTWVNLDYLFWTASQNGLDYARSGFSIVALDPGPVTPATTSGTTREIGNPASSGFKIGTGYILQHDRWDLALQYTWYQNVGTDHAEGAYAPLWDIAGFRRLLPSFTGVFLFQNTSATWKLRLNVFDFSLGRAFRLSKYFRLHPFIGLKSYWQTQTFDIAFDTLANPINTASVDYPSYLAMHAQQKSWGIGGRGGIDTGWYFSPNWSLFGNVSISALWNQFNLRRKDNETLIQQTTGGAPVDITVIWKSSGNDTLVPIVELTLALQYEQTFKNERYRMKLRAGWEEQVWFDMNQFIQIFDCDGSNDNLVMQGLTVEARFEF